MGYPSVYAVTLNWNGKEDTIECIRSLKKLDYPRLEIVVVDNGSTDGSVPAFKATYPDITIIENGRNLGYAEGFNAGARYAVEEGADYFLILNNDTVVDPDMLKELVRVAEQDTRIGFVSGKVYFYNDPNRLQTIGAMSDPVFLVGEGLGYGELDEGQYDEVREFDFVDDVFLLVRSAVFDQVGGYDPTFFLMYEETDWCVRVRRAGFKIVYTPRAKIWHKGNRDPLTGVSTTHQFYRARNQIPFVYRNSSGKQFRRFLAALLTGYAPRKIWYLTKIGEFRLLSAYVRGLGSGIFWALKQRTRTAACRAGIP